VPKELGTRVNTSAIKVPDTKVQAVQFFRTEVEEEARRATLSAGNNLPLRNAVGGITYSTWADLNQFFIEQLANGLVLQSPLASAVRSLSTSTCIM